MTIRVTYKYLDGTLETHLVEVPGDRSYDYSVAADEAIDTAQPDRAGAEIEWIKTEQVK